MLPRGALVRKADVADVVQCAVFWPGDLRGHHLTSHNYKQAEKAFTPYHRLLSCQFEKKER